MCRPARITDQSRGCLAAVAKNRCRKNVHGFTKRASQACGLVLSDLVNLRPQTETQIRRGNSPLASLCQGFSMLVLKNLHPAERCLRRPRLKTAGTARWLQPHRVFRGCPEPPGVQPNPWGKISTGGMESPTVILRACAYVIERVPPGNGNFPVCRCRPDRLQARRSGQTKSPFQEGVDTLGRSP